MPNIFPVLRCKDFRYQYAPGSPSYHFDVEIASPDFIRIVGKSGAGKSTFLALLGGFLSPVSGELLLGDQTITHALPHKRHMAFLFQTNNLFFHLTAFQNIALGISPSLKLDLHQEQAIYDALEDIQLAAFAHRRVETLSGGQQQRVAIARCFVQESSYLLLDEPFSSLDPELRKELVFILAERAKKNAQSVLMVTHFPDELTSIAQRTLEIKDHTLYEGAFPVKKTVS